MNKEEIAHLAQLARIKMTDEEMNKIAKDFEGILKYVEHVNEVTGDAGEQKIESALAQNVMREDEITDQPGDYTDRILAAAPESQDDFVKVKKILNND